MKGLIVVAVSFVVALSVGATVTYGIKQYQLSNIKLTAEERVQLKEGFIEGCMLEPKLWAFCECAFDNLITNHGYDKLYAISLKQQETNEVPKELNTAVMACYEKIPGKE